jgi:hypothetical protein
VGIEGKILSFEVLCSFIVGRVIGQNSAQDNGFGFYIGRQPARDVDVDSGYVPSRLPAIWSRSTYLSLEILVLVPNHLLLHKFLDRFGADHSALV